ncbi:DUF4190 domain-containing protein [Streptomyces purpurogeneiscleroticus]|uniref:DUF4190 domain-containing protein n=1 Tax=Streptomyces purpurogeneiscleroticus TaxID=68259 RepID=UPI001CBBEA18|nr:DUF4190 domain-containing protein [Streptomyces purpurogeneiscleroticus]MBZ4014602.1 hypothetical protein [Streptomyces purpurogeneiscleroticus]
MSQQMQFPPGAPVPTGAPAPQAARNGLGIAALVLGVIGALSGLIPLMFWFAGTLGLLALIFGLVGRGRAKRGQATNKGVALAGALLGIASLILSVVGAVITFTAVKDTVDEINKSLETSTAQPKSGGSEGEDAAGTGGDSKDAEGEALHAGDTAEYDTGLSVTVSKATAYNVGEFAVGHKEGQKAYKFTVQLENKGKEKFDSTLTLVEARAGKDGKAAEQIFDGTVGEGFNGKILPGKSASVEFAFDTPAGAKNLDVEVSPGLEHEASQWDLGL